MIQEFDELLCWQAEIADSIVQLQTEILKYEDLENQLLKRREQAMIHHALGLKNELKEIEYGLHYVQTQMNQKKKQLQSLQEDFQQKVDDIIKYYKNYKMTLT
ncbi:hypothetical protein [Caldalkalibacillus mannanilyticus]|uniref:hypothetical protein n=1 Tax=Caldalkalibacillus mannanilyticus TaxID=1418 RepID=UPI00046A8BB9|nr:hypothetical protein [Caldalkalibacillus mannanilyticus]